ncbi:hypothetical protein V6N13_118595 [Hibiscus sabdariffa]
MTSFVEPTIPANTREAAVVVVYPSSSHRQQLHAKTSSLGKSLGNPKKPTSISLAARKPSVIGVTVVSHAINSDSPAVILDLAKHQATHIYDNDHPRIPTAAITGGHSDHDHENAKGCGHRNFIRVTRQYLRDHSPDVIGFVETRISSIHSEKVIVDLNFPSSFKVEAIGFFEGIWLY